MTRAGSKWDGSPFEIAARGVLVRAPRNGFETRCSTARPPPATRPRGALIHGPGRVCSPPWRSSGERAARSPRGPSSPRARAPRVPPARVARGAPHVQRRARARRRHRRRGAGRAGGGVRADSRARRQSPGHRRQPARSSRTLAQLRAHAHAANAQARDGARSRRPEPDAARLVRGAARRRKLGVARPHPEGELGRLSELVPEDARHPRLPGHARGRARVGRGRARVEGPLLRERRRRRGGGRARAPCGARHGHRGIGTVARARDDPRPAGASLRAHARGHRLRGPPRQARRRTGRRRVVLRQRVDGARARSPRSAPLLPALGAREGQPVPLGGVRGVPAPLRGSARRREVAFHPADPAHGSAPACRHVPQGRGAPRISSPSPHRLPFARSARRRGPHRDRPGAHRVRLRHRRNGLRHRSRASGRSSPGSSSTSRDGRTGTRPPRASGTRT